MEEILASIRRIIADDQAHSAPFPADAVNVDAGIDFSAITFDDDAHDEPLPQPRETIAAPAAAPPPAAAKAVSAKAAGAPAREATAAREATPAAAPDEQVSPVAPAAEPLLSSAADASAASAFSTLSSVVLNRSPRTLDDLVQDMLRPLLKSWLDEHLPPLVEKLVKAEIERISRGNR